jgi:vacuolar-type H+-ATPase subunit H
MARVTERSGAGKSARTAAPTADRVGAILGAAEESAKRMLEQTEERVRQRIAEADRAAENRVTAAEEEAAEILAEARQEAEKAKSDATSEALTIMARAQEDAESVITQAREDAIKSTKEAEARSRELMSEARAAATQVRDDGQELVGNLGEMSEALRSNSQRLLRDVQRVYSQLVAKLDAVDGSFAATQRSQGGRARPAAVARDSAAGRDRELPPPPDNGEVLDVPEFIPPS